MQIRDFQLQRNERPEDGMLRIIHGQIDLVCDLCKHMPVSAEDSVHEIRKGIKRIRSVIRLLRFSLGEERFLEENNRFGSISLLLADLRKSAVHLEILKTIFDRPQTNLLSNTGKSLKKSFRKKKAGFYRSLARKNNVLSRCLQQIAEAKKQLKGNPPVDIKPDILLAGYAHTYKTGRRRLRKAMQDPSMENNHNLRKAVKNLWNQSQVLRILWTTVLNPYIRSLDRLGDLLGMDHDLAELEAAIKEEPLLSGKEFDQGIKVVEVRRKKCQRSAWQLACKIYAETPAAFLKRMGAYWKQAMSNEQF